MSLRDYEISREIDGQADWGEDFYALVMVLMRNADTSNAAKLRNAWPEVWDEYEQRYSAPGGLLVGESRRGAGGTMERRADGLYFGLDGEDAKLVRAT